MAPLFTALKLFILLQAVAEGKLRGCDNGNKNGDKKGDGKGVRCPSPKPTPEPTILPIPAPTEVPIPAPTQGPTEVPPRFCTVSFTTYETKSTDSATVNTVDVPINGICDGDVATFSTCDGNEKQDTYLRLFDGDSQVAYNDNGGVGCRTQSSMTYEAGEASSCNELTLKQGCSGTRACVATTVVSFTDNYPFGPCGEQN